jgi:hypothetical protein
MVSQLHHFATVVNQATSAAGTEGILGDRVIVEDAQGIWAEMISNINVCRFTKSMISALSKLSAHRMRMEISPTKSVQ